MMDEADDTRGQKVDLHANFLSTRLMLVYKYIILNPFEEISSLMSIGEIARISSLSNVYSLYVRNTVTNYIIKSILPL